ncbi:methyl-accepting chemotaxis protein [Celeribacter indicus]|uniref:Methyl-accepting chemotaxis protein McpA n=1 Tax=Celeribacter indicus TaxID=1208324 RepID=A0A0B5E1I1_9RHOB|nr:methyl-accepting chemotaxis protein [Celeribacter indicus]AJE46891.1 methyl-accepting chemotaxis protein McpA [Celeribacter indicus]SDW79339.1 methyl-accepting chemotaxis sensory transducer with Pas/Pac sensor [Celeribacter indicus]
MNFFRRIRLARKLPAIMIGLTAASILVANLMSYRSASGLLLAEAEQALATVAEARKLELGAWLDGVDVDLRSQAHNPTMLSALRGFGEAWKGIGESPSAYLRTWYIDDNPNPADRRHDLEYAADGSAYSQVHKLYHGYFRELVDEKGYDDVFVFSPAGDLLYSVFKREDFATNFVEGTHADTGLGRAFRRALAATGTGVVFEDFTRYGPFSDAPAAFLAAPVTDRGGVVQGVIAFQMPASRIDAITTRPTGLGRTGDAYLLGEDFLLRSRRIHGSAEETLRLDHDTPAARAAISGRSGVLRETGEAEGTRDDRLSAYFPVDYQDVRWGLIADQSIGEILEPATRLSRTMIWQGVLMTAIAAMLGLAIARTVSGPLSRVERAMRAVAEGDYAIDVPGTERGDEIGAIATALDDFRRTLGEAEATSRDGLFKSAAFEGSSAALMMIDRNFVVSYANVAMHALFERHRQVFTRMYAAFDPDRIVGENIDIFHATPGRIRSMLADPAGMPFQTDMRLGDVHFALSVNAILDAEGEQIGCVMEWQDVTDIRTNEAVITALDENQAKVEFDVDGHVVKANENFARLRGVRPADLVGRHHEEIFTFDPKLVAEGGPVWDRLRTGSSVTGRFGVQDGSGTVSTVEGTFSPVKDAAGRPFRIILLGTDITRSEAALVAAEQQRARMKAEQDQVVEGLRVGLRTLAAGDLTTRITNTFAPEYETLRKDFNQAIETLLLAMRRVVENADMIRGEASEISNAADDLSRRTEKQAATLEETATALDELTSSVRSAAEGADQASRMVETARADAEASGQVVQEAVAAMSEIESASHQISKITSVIDDIAFQTNLLALNAGVEAARAGEAGRGFAVVASEVRALAQRSSEAAREINELISKSGALVTRGVGLVGETGEALRGIVSSVSDISRNVSEIALSAREQSVGLAEINAAVNQLDQVTQQNAAMFEQTTAASHALTREAETLTGTTSRFSIGLAAAPRPVAAPPAVEPRAAPARPKPARIAAPVRRAVNAAPVAAETLAEDDWEDF